MRFALDPCLFKWLCSCSGCWGHLRYDSVFLAISTPQLQTLIHNLAITLSWTKFDGKIMIYIEFCTQKLSQFLGVSYFWGTIPQKYQFLAGPTPNAQV